jgi:hypothetical protein
MLSAWVEHMLLNGAAQIEETAVSFPQFAQLHSVTCVELRLITILGNRGCVAVASFLGVPSPLVVGNISFFLRKKQVGKNVIAFSTKRAYFERLSPKLFIYLGLN